MAAVLIRGEGVAGSCCLRLLRDAGLQISVEVSRRPQVPAVMLGETTQKLLRDVFARDDLFRGFPGIRRRVVLWGAGAEPVALPHSAIVASEKELLERVQQGFQSADDLEAHSPDWTVLASSLSPFSVERHFGSRPAAASPVVLQPGSDTESCWIESVENGWLFLLPAGQGAGWLLSVGGSVEGSLATSRLIKDQIAELRPSRGTFSSHPRVAFPLAGPGWLACGTAALGFDPICGDGAGNAVREAILGSAVIRAALATGDTDNLVAHYQMRLLGGLQRHLALCFDFYKSGRSGPWWDHQLNELAQGLSWCSQQLGRPGGSRYRLNGFSLERAD